MAFNLTAQLNLQGPANVKQIAAQIRRDLGNINATVNFRLDPAVTRNVASLSSALRGLNATFGTTASSANAASVAIKKFGDAINTIKAGNISQQINAAANATSKLDKASAVSSKSISSASAEMQEFGKQAGLAVRRFVAFSTVTSVIYGVTNSINEGISAFIDYDKELVKLQQITGESSSGLSKLQAQITSLSTTYGVSSKELTSVASTLAQAGLTARETEKALKALALSSLAPSFDSMNETVEGSIALMRQFGISADDLEASLGAVNTVAAKFAVESSDIITAIQRTGSVFATASKGVSEGKDALNEFIAVFTSVRATTRESAETIATGLRTIFTRIQRGSTINALKEFGVNLTDAEGKFVGAYKAVELLSQGLRGLDPRSLQFSKIVEELGGFRQIGKVIPLIQQFTVAQEALKTAQSGQGSLAKDAAVAQLSLANQISKVRQEFFALFREIGQSKGFQSLIRGALALTSGLIKVADAVKGILPALAVLTAFKGLTSLTQFATGFSTGVRRGPDGKANGGIVRKFARGGIVPGVGNGDTVPAMLEPGEFVIRKKAVETIGVDNLHSMNKYGSGGNIRGAGAGKRKRFAKGGPVAVEDLKEINPNSVQPDYRTAADAKNKVGEKDNTWSTYRKDGERSNVRVTAVKYMQPDDQVFGEVNYVPVKDPDRSEVERYFGNITFKKGTKFINPKDKRISRAYEDYVESKVRDIGARFTGEYDPLDFETGDAKFYSSEVNIEKYASINKVLSKRLRHQNIKKAIDWQPTTPETKELPSTTIYHPTDLSTNNNLKQKVSDWLLLDSTQKTSQALRSGEKFNIGGKIQKFMDGGLVEQGGNKYLESDVIKAMSEVKGIQLSREDAIKEFLRRNEDGDWYYTHWGIPGKSQKPPKWLAPYREPDALDRVQGAMMEKQDRIAEWKRKKGLGSSEYEGKQQEEKTFLRSRGKYAYGGLVQKFMAGGKAKETRPFGSGDFPFPKRISNAYFKELDAILEKEQVEKAYSGGLGYLEYPSEKRIRVEPSRATETFDSTPLDRKAFAESFKRRVSALSIYKDMSNFAKFIGLPREDLSLVLPENIDFSNMGGLDARGQFDRTGMGRRGFEGYDLSSYGYGSAQKQDLYGYEKLVAEKQKEMKKILKTPVRTFDDGSFIYDTDASKKTWDEINDLQIKIMNIKKIKLDAQKKAGDQIRDTAAKTGRGSVTINSGSLGFTKNSTLYHELTHQLIQGIRTRSADSFDKYKKRVVQLFGEDNDDLADAFDALENSYNSADVVYGRSYKIKLLNQVIQNNRNTSGGTALTPTAQKEAYDMWSASLGIKKAKEYKPINPNVNKALLDNSIKQDVIDRVEDSGKEEFLTTLVQNANRLNPLLQETLDTTLSELLGSVGITRQQYASGGIVSKFMEGGTAKPKKNIVTTSPTPPLQAILERIAQKPEDKRKGAQDYAFQAYREELTEILNNAYRGILSGGTRPTTDPITPDSVVSFYDQHSDDSRGYVNATIKALEEDLKYVSGGGDTTKGALKPRKGVGVGDMLDTIRAYQSLGLDYVLNTALATGRTNETLKDFMGEDLPDAYAAAGVDKVKISEFVKHMDAAAQYKFPKKLYSGLGDSKLDIILKDTGITEKNKPEDLVGKTFTMPSFLSASDAEALAVSFARTGMLTITPNPKKKGIIPEKSKETTINRESLSERSKKARLLQSVTGQKGFAGNVIDESYADAYDSEGEYIFPSNSRFKITDVEKSTARLFDKSGRNIRMDVQQLADGGIVERKIGIIDTDVLRDPANASIVKPAMEKLGLTDTSQYSIELGRLAAKARKEKSLSKLIAIAGAAGSGKSSLATGVGANDDATLRKTTRSPILTPEDISKVNEVIALTSTVAENKLDAYLRDADRAYVLSSTTPEEIEQIGTNRTQRDLTGQGLYGRRPGTTVGASRDFALEETTLRDELGKKTIVLGRKKGSFGLRRKRENELPEIVQAGGFYTGGFSPPTRGHRGAFDTLLGSMIARNPSASAEDIILSIAPNLPMDRGEGKTEQEKLEHAARYGIFPADFRKLLAQINFPTSMISTQETPQGNVLPPMMEVEGVDGRRRFAKLKGALAITSGKKEGALDKYGRAGMKVTDIPRIDDISATAVRKALFAGDDATLMKFLNPEVASVLMGNRAQLRNRSVMVPMLIEEIKKYGAVQKEQTNSEIQKILADAPGGPYSRITKKARENAPDVVAQVERMRKERDQKAEGLLGYRAHNIVSLLSAKYPDAYGLDISRRAQVSAKPADLAKETISAQIAEGMGGEFGDVPTVLPSSVQQAILEKVTKETAAPKGSGELPTTAKEVLTKLGDKVLPTDPKFGEFSGKSIRDTAKGGKLGYWMTKFPATLATKPEKLAAYEATRDYIKDLYSGTATEATAQALATRTTDVGQSTLLAMVGLYGKNAINGPLTWNLGQNAKGEDVSMSATIMERVLPEKYKSVSDYISSQIDITVAKAAEMLGKKDAKKLSEKQKGVLNQGNIEGGILEQLLAVLGGDVLDDAVRTRAIDFPGGIGEFAAEIFGIPPNIPTEAKRTISSDSRNDAIKEFQRYFRGVYGIPEPVEPVKKLALGGFAKRFATGGSSEDTVPALLTPGEFVINKKAAEKIGYYKLNQLNKADKIQGYNKGGMVNNGIIQRFAGGGILQGLSGLMPGGLSQMLPFILPLLSDYLPKSRSKKLQARPEEINSGTVQASSSLISNIKILTKSFNEAGYSMMSLDKALEQMKEGMELSYKDIEKAMTKDLERLKISGASIDKIMEAEKALKNIRDESSISTTKKQFLEAGFRESKSGKALGSGASQQKIAIEADKIEKSIRAQREKQLTQSLSGGPGGYGPAFGNKDQIKEEVQKRLKEQEREIKELSYSSATQKVTGIKKSELASMDISGADIQSYISQSMTDRKTLAQMDKQLIAMRLEEYKNAGTVRGISVKSASEAKKLADEEISQRRAIINEMAKEQGRQGVGAAGLMDIKNSPIAKAVRNRYFGGTFSQGFGKASFDASIAAGLVASQGENIASVLYNDKTDKGKVKAAAEGARITGAATTLSVGLATAAQLTAINPVLGVATAIATAGYAAADAMFDFSGNVKKAAEEMTRSLLNEKLQAATDSLANALKKLSVNVENAELRQSVASAIRNQSAMALETTDFESKSAKTKAETERNWSDFFRGVLLGPKALEQSKKGSYVLPEARKDAYKEAEKYQMAANAGYEDLQRLYSKGFTNEQIMDPSNAAGNIVRNSITSMILSDPERLAQYMAAGPHMAAGPLGREAIIGKEAQQEFLANNPQAKAMEEAAKLARALELAEKAGRRLAASFEKIADVINQSINKLSFEADLRTEATSQRAAALRGESTVSGPKLREKNILENPNAYSEDQFNAALATATQGLDAGTRKQIIGGSQLQQNIPKSIVKSIAVAVGPGGSKSANVSDLKDTAIKTATEEIEKNKNLSREQKDNLIAIAKAKIEDMAKKAEQGNTDPAARVAEFVKGLEDGQNILGDFGKNLLESAKALLTFREGALSKFAEGLNQASKAAKEARDFFKSSRDIRNEASLNLREIMKGYGETYEEKKTRILGDVGALAGGQTTPEGIKQRMVDLESQRNKEYEKRQTLVDAKALEESTRKIRSFDDQIRDTKEALNILADTTELVEKAFNDLKNTAELQNQRQSFVNTLLTNTPDEADKLNRSFINLQRNLSGGLNTAATSRDARKEFNKTLRETGSVRQARRAGETVLANQRKETLALMQDPGFRAAQELNIRNQYAQGKGKPGVTADEAVAEYFKNQQLQVTRQMAIESGMINNPLVQQSLAALEDKNADPAMKQAAEKYLEAMGLKADATKQKGELALLESQLLLKDSNENLRASIDNLRATIEGNLKTAAIGTDAAGNRVVDSGVAVAAPARPKAHGGLIYANQGELINFQAQGTDTVPAMLTPGEFVINAKSTAEYLPLLKAINSGYYAEGGLVDVANMSLRERQVRYRQEFNDRVAADIRKARQEKENAKDEELSIIREGFKTRTVRYDSKLKYNGFFPDRTVKVPNPLTDPAYDFLDEYEREHLARILKEQKEGTYKPDIRDMELMKDLSRRASLSSGSMWAKENVPKMTAGEHGGMLSYISDMESKIRSYNMHPATAAKASTIPESEQVPKTWEGYINLKPKLNRTDPDEPQQSFRPSYISPKDKAQAEARIAQDAQISNGITIKGKYGPVDILPGPLVSDQHFMNQEEEDRLSRIMREQADGSYEPTNDDIEFVRGMRKRVTSIVRGKDAYWNRYSGGDTGGAGVFFEHLEQQTRKYHDDPRYDIGKHQDDTDIVGRGFKATGKSYYVRPGPLGSAIMDKREQEEVARIFKEQEAGTYVPNEADQTFVSKLKEKAQRYRNPATLRQYSGGDYGQGITFFEQLDQQVKNYGKQDKTNITQGKAIKPTKEMSPAERVAGQLAYQRQQAYLSRFRPELRAQKEKELLEQGRLYFQDGSSPKGKMFALEGSRSTQTPIRMPLDAVAPVQSFGPDDPVTPLFRGMIGIFRRLAWRELTTDPTEIRSIIWAFMRMFTGAKPSRFANGGMVYAADGALVNFEPKGTDIVPAMLTPGEFVVNARSTAEHLPLLKAINSGNYSKGGVVYLAQGGSVNPEAQKRKEERIDAQKESWMMSEATGRQPNEVVSRTASSWAQSQVGDGRWMSMTEDERQSEAKKYEPEFQSRWDNYNNRKNDEQLRSANDAGYGSIKEDPNSGIVGVHFYNEEKKRARERFEQASAAETAALNNQVAGGSLGDPRYPWSFGTPAAGQGVELPDAGFDPRHITTLPAIDDGRRGIDPRHIITLPAIDDGRRGIDPRHITTLPAIDNGRILSHEEMTREYNAMVPQYDPSMDRTSRNGLRRLSEARAQKSRADAWLRDQIARRDDAIARGVSDAAQVGYNPTYAGTRGVTNRPTIIEGQRQSQLDNPLESSVPIMSYQSTEAGFNTPTQITPPSFGGLPIAPMSPQQAENIPINTRLSQARQDLATADERTLRRIQMGIEDRARIAAQEQQFNREFAQGVESGKYDQKDRDKYLTQRRQQVINERNQAKLDAQTAEIDSRFNLLVKSGKATEDQRNQYREEQRKYMPPIVKDTMLSYRVPSDDQLQKDEATNQQIIAEKQQQDQIRQRQVQAAEEKTRQESLWVNSDNAAVAGLGYVGGVLQGAGDVLYGAANVAAGAAVAATAPLTGAIGYGMSGPGPDTSWTAEKEIRLRKSIAEGMEAEATANGYIPSIAEIRRRQDEAVERARRVYGEMGNAYIESTKAAADVGLRAMGAGAISAVELGQAAVGMGPIMTGEQTALQKNDARNVELAGGMDSLSGFGTAFLQTASYGSAALAAGLVAPDPAGALVSVGAKGIARIPRVGNIAKAAAKGTESISSTLGTGRIVSNLPEGVKDVGSAVSNVTGVRGISPDWLMPVIARTTGAVGNTIKQGAGAVGNTIKQGAGAVGGAVRKIARLPGSISSATGRYLKTASPFYKRVKPVKPSTVDVTDLRAFRQTQQNLAIDLSDYVTPARKKKFLDEFVDKSTPKSVSVDPQAIAIARKKKPRDIRPKRNVAGMVTKDNDMVFTAAITKTTNVQHELAHSFERNILGATKRKKYSQATMRQIESFVDDPKGLADVTGGKGYTASQIKKAPHELISTLFEYIDNVKGNKKAERILKTLMKLHGYNKGGVVRYYRDGGHIDDHENFGASGIVTPQYKTPERERQIQNVPKLVDGRAMYASGGLVYANNGALIPSLSHGSDTVPAMLTPGEFVVNREASQKHMPLLHAINDGYFTRGGIVNYLANGGIVAPKYYANAGPVTGNNAGVSNDISSSISAAVGQAMNEAVGQLSTTLQSGMETYTQMMQSSTETLNNFGQTFSNASQTIANSANTWSETANQIPNTLTAEITGRQTVNITGLGQEGEKIINSAAAAGQLAGSQSSQNILAKYDISQFGGNLNTAANSRPMRT